MVIDMADATSAVVGMVPLVMSVAIVGKTMDMAFPKPKARSRKKR